MSAKNHSCNFERMWLKLMHVRWKDLAKANRPAVKETAGLRVFELSADDLDAGWIQIAESSKVRKGGQ